MQACQFERSPDAQCAAQAVHVLLLACIEVLVALVAPWLLGQELCKLGPVGQDGKHVESRWVCMYLPGTLALQFQHLHNHNQEVPCYHMLPLLLSVHASLVESYARTTTATSWVVHSPIITCPGWELLLPSRSTVT